LTIKGCEHLTLQGKAERTVTVQPGEEKAQGDLSHLCEHLMGTVKKM